MSDQVAGDRPTLGEYAEIIETLADHIGPAAARDLLRPDMHAAYYDAIDRAAMRRFAAFYERRMQQQSEESAP